MSWYCRHGSDRFAFSTERGTSSWWQWGCVLHVSSLFDVVVADVCVCKCLAGLPVLRCVSAGGGHIEIEISCRVVYQGGVCVVLEPAIFPRYLRQYFVMLLHYGGM